MFGKSRGGRNAHRQNRASGLNPTSPQEATELAHRAAASTSAASGSGGGKQSLPPPQPPGMPIPVPDILPWLLISIASYAAFLYLPGRVSSPRARVTLIGGNEFINVASHIHFCAWVWILQDFVFRLCAVLLFPPKRAAVYFLGMFTVPTTTTTSSLTTAVIEDSNSNQILETAAAAVGSEVVSAATEILSSSSSSSSSLSSSSSFLTTLMSSILRPIRSLLVQPAPGQLDFVPVDYKPFDSRTHGGVDRGSTYWHYKSVCIASYGVMFAIWALVTYLYHTRHVIRQIREKAEHRRKGKEERKKQSAKIKREFRLELEKRRDKIIQDQKQGIAVTKEEIDKVNAMLAQLETGEKNLAEDEFSDEDVDYDPYGRPVPDPPFVPTVSWMVLWSMTFGGAFVWVQALPILVGQLFPVAIGGILVFCVMMPQ